MISGFEQAARNLLGEATADGHAPVALAERADHALEQISTRLASLLGTEGVSLIRKRSTLLASAKHAWLIGVADNPAGLRTAMETHDAETITKAFVAILSAYVGLLERLIGEGIVQRLLDEIWPTIFTYAPEDTP